MTDTKEHNGWTNYATWRVQLEIIDGIAWSKEEVTFKTIDDLIEYVRDTVENVVFGDEGGDSTALMAGYARAFLEDVNYKEIADHIADIYKDIITPSGNTQDGKAL